MTSDIAAVICEYNPFHTGHAHHLARTREAVAGPLVCIMSGHFVQRGEPALFSPHARAEMAVAPAGAPGGYADLVVELPLPYALSTAELFARGGVAIARALKASVLSFGSESGDEAALCSAADLADSPKFDALLRRELTSGQTFAAARTAAMQTLDPRAAATLRTPNDALGVEYCRAMRYTAIRPLVIPRVGAGHDAPMAAQDPAPARGYISAQALRGMLTQEDARAMEYMPRADIWRRELACGRAPILTQALDVAVLSRLRELSPADFVAYADVSEGLEHRLCRAVREAGTLVQACDLAKTRRYTHARIRRAFWNAYLRIPAAYARQNPPFIRVLALNERGRAVLRQATLPILTKPAQIRHFSDEAQAWFRIDCQAADLCALAAPDPARRVADGELRASPYYAT